MTIKQKTDKIIERTKSREYFYSLLVKLFCIIQDKGLRMIVENPYSGTHYLILPQNFVMPPSYIDHNRRLRGDYFIKPTAYWFVNCEQTFGESFTTPKITKIVLKTKGSNVPGVCSEERSMISPDYARNFICDKIIGKPQKNTQLTLFNNDNEQEQ